MGWDEAQGLITDPEYQKSVGLTADMAAEVLRDVETLKRGAEEKEEKARLQTQRENEGEMWGMWMDKTLTESEVRSRFEQGIIDDTVRDDYIKRLRTRQPVITDDEMEWDITAAIRKFEQGEKGFSFEAVEKMIYQNGDKLSDADRTGLRDKLYAAEKSGGGAVMKRTMTKTLFGQLDTLRNQAYFISGADEDWGDKKVAELKKEQLVENARIFTAVHDEFSDWLKEHSDASDDEIAAKFTGLIAPSQNEVALGWWRRAWNMGQDEQEIRNRRQWQGLLAGREQAEERQAQAMTERDLPAELKGVWEEYKAGGGTWEEFIEVAENREGRF